MQEGDKVTVKGREQEDYRFLSVTGRFMKKVWCYKQGDPGMWEFPIEMTNVPEKSHKEASK